MRKTVLFFLAAAVTFTLSAAPRIDAKETNLGDGRTLYKKTVHLNNGSLNIAYATRDGVNVERKKYGESFFGFVFGGLPNINGGWSPWDFCRCLEYVKGKGVFNLFQTRVPKNITVNQVNGIAIVDMTYPAFQKGEVKIRMMQFPAHPEWTFIRIQGIDFEPWRIDFIAYPYKADLPKERERFIRYPGGDHNITVTKNKHNYVPEEPFIALYNKKVQETAGNLFVFEPEKYKTAEGICYGAGAEIRLRTQTGIPSFCFALGSFKNKPAAEALNHFFNEEGSTISKFLEEIDWNLKAK